MKSILSKVSIIFLSFLTVGVLYKNYLFTVEVGLSYINRESFGMEIDVDHAESKIYLIDNDGQISEPETNFNKNQVINSSNIFELNGKKYVGYIANLVYKFMEQTTIGEGENFNFTIKDLQTNKNTTAYLGTEDVGVGSAISDLDYSYKIDNSGKLIADDTGNINLEAGFFQDGYFQFVPIIVLREVALEETTLTEFEINFDLKFFFYLAPPQQENNE